MNTKPVEREALVAAAIDPARSPRVAGAGLVLSKTRRVHRRPGISALVVAFLAGAMLLGAVSPATATLITYSFTPDASITFSSGNVETVSGSFAVDTVSAAVSQVSFTLASAAPEADVYDILSDLSINPTRIILFVMAPERANPPTNTLSISLLGAIGGPLTIDPNGEGLALRDHAALLGVEHSVAATGGALPVPEPTSLALLSVALCLFRLFRRTET